MNKNIGFQELKTCFHIITIVSFYILVNGCKKNPLNNHEIPSDFQSYLNSAEYYYDKNHRDSTFYYLTKISILFPETPDNIDSVKVGLVNTLFGFYYEDINQPDSALYYHQKAYQNKIIFFKGNHPEVSKSINNIGLLYQKYGKYEISQVYFNEAISQVKNSPLYQKELIKYTINLANNYYLEKKYTASLNILLEIISLNNKENKQNLYLSVANNYLGLKEYEKAIEYYTKAYQIKNQNFKIKAQIANNIGNTYSAINKENDAIAYYQKSLKLREKIKITSNNEMGEIHANIGSSLLKTNQLDAAKEHLEIAKKFILKNIPINQIALSGIEENLGQLFLKKYDIESAIKFFNQAQYIHDTILSTPEAESSNRYLNLASLYMMPPYRDTLKGLFFLNKIGKKASDLQKINKFLILTSISLQQNNKEKAEKYLLEAEKLVQYFAFENLISHIETLLQISSFYEKLDQYKKAENINANGLKLINELKDNKNISFYHLVLRYYLIETNLYLKKNNHIKASVIALNQMNYIDSIQKNNTELKKDRFINEMKTNFISNFFEANSYYLDNLKKLIYFPYSEDKFPEKYSNTMFIRYWTTKNKLIIWTQANKKIDVIIKPIDFPLDKTILSVRNAIRELPVSGIKSKENYEKIYQNLVKKLSVLLVPPIPNKIKNIILFPDQILTILPFEILYDGKKITQNLIENYTITYHYIKDAPAYKPNKPLKNKIIAFSPTFQNDTRGFANLKYSEIELDNISQHMPMVKYMNKKASAENFKKEAKKYNLIHIATHSDPNLNDDEKGGELIFTENANHKESSSLYANQITTLKIRANLVVLSACQSAIGSYIPTQGMNSIAQSFLNGGASSVLTSLWQVDDRSTSIFMNSFYYYLSKGYSKNKALQFAKKKMINQSPYFWAPFILIGDAGTI